MKRVIAFADEFGNNSLDFHTQGSHFIVASAIINATEADKADNQLEPIRSKYFQTGEVKSNKVGGNQPFNC